MMKLIRIVPFSELQPFIDNMWLFESETGVPVSDNRIIAPNAKAKIIIPFRNALITNIGANTKEYKEQELYFIGVWDKPVVLSSREQPTGTIGIELTPNGVHRFIKIPMIEMTNRIFTLTELFGVSAQRLQRRMEEADHPDDMVELIQNFLMCCLRENNRENNLVDYLVKYIMAQEGMIDLHELERKTGYTKRYLNMIFDDHIGLSPKAFSNIIRFQQFYRLWANSEAASFFKDSLYEFYYDQAHFIKEFKRFTGYAPGQYAKAKNDFGKIFYRK